MKRVILASVLFCLAAIFMTGSFVGAQQEDLSRRCVTAFFDSNEYGWLAFKNNCSESLNIEWFWKTRDHSGSAGVARPGRSVNTGMSQREVSERGGYELYTCPAGYMAVDGAGRPIYDGGSNPQNYSCKKQ